MTIDRLVSVFQYTVLLLTLRTIMYVLISMKFNSVKDKLNFMRTFWMKDTLYAILIMIGSIKLINLPWPLEALAAYTTTLLIAALAPWKNTFKMIANDENNTIAIIKSSLYCRRMHFPLFSVLYPMVLTYSKCPFSFRVAAILLTLLCLSIQYFGFILWLPTQKETKHV